MQYNYRIHRSNLKRAIVYTHLYFLIVCNVRSIYRPLLKVWFSQKSLEKRLHSCHQLKTPGILKYVNKQIENKGLFICNKKWKIQLPEAYINTTKGCSLPEKTNRLAVFIELNINSVTLKL